MKDTWKPSNPPCSFYTLNSTLNDTCSAQICEFMGSLMLKFKWLQVLFPNIEGVMCLTKCMQFVRD